MTGLFSLMSSLILFPLQITASDFNMDTEVSITQVIVFLCVFAAIIVTFVIINRRMPTAGGKKSKKGGVAVPIGSSYGFLAMMSLHRLARNIGLNNLQIRMLDFAFRLDGATEPEKSIATPALLDRHFRRAYRVIEHSGDSDTQRKLAILFSTRNILENSSIGTISSTKQLKEDEVILITHGKEKIEIGVLAARNDLLIVEAPVTVLGSHIRIPQGTHLSALFFTKNNKVFSFETRVISYGNLQGAHTLNLAHSNKLKFMSQRRFRRRQTSIACFLNLVYVEGSGKKTRLVVDKRRINGNIADISVGGCSIKAMAPVQVGAKFKIEFQHINTTVAALGQVLRTNRAGMNTTVHIKFLKVSQKSMNIINAFVYEYSNE